MECAMSEQLLGPEVDGIDLDFSPASTFPMREPERGPPSDGERQASQGDGRVYRMVMPGISAPECLPRMRVWS